MNRIHLAILALAAGGAASCSDTTGTRTLISDDELTADIAATSGDAIGSAIESMLGNEAASALPYMVNAGRDPSANDVTVSRTRTCYDAANVVVANCSPMSSVRKVVTHVAGDGTRAGTHTRTGGRTVSWTGAVHRTMDDTLTRNFSAAEPPTEVSRTHSAVGTSNDTTSFSDGTVARVARESAVDSVRAVTWSLPRQNNPFPVSGSIVRNTSVNATITRGDETQSRSFSRRIQVTFPADAQGNVVLQIDDKTCNLNLVTRAVSNCR